MAIETEGMKALKPILNVGDIVNVRNSAMGGENFDEGKARLVKYCDNYCDYHDGSRDEAWLVQFVRDGNETYRRNIRISKYKVKQHKKEL